MPATMFRTGQGTNDPPSRGDAGRDDVRSWLLALLRYAVTRSAGDRLCVLELARLLDRAGRAEAFSFFWRSSLQLCDLIADEDAPDRVKLLGQWFARVADDRLRNALEAATGCQARRPKKRAALWRQQIGDWKGLVRDPAGAQARSGRPCGRPPGAA